MAESEFAQLVDELGADPAARDKLIDLLHESHPAYEQRGTAATVRMRGWILATFARVGLPDSGLVYALEELDTGRDPYLVAAAARALRSRNRADPTFAKYLARAIGNVRHHDDFVSFASYGAYVDHDAGTTAVSEVFATLRWLGPAARGAMPELDLLMEEHRRAGLPAALWAEVAETVSAIERSGAHENGGQDCCTLPWGLARRFYSREARIAALAIESTVFEDHDGHPVAFNDMFIGRPSVVVFFYTRCDNPRKCSLSIAKLARLQGLILDRGIAGQVRTAAISYDPAWDLPDRLRGYAESRSVRLDKDNRVLRSTPEALSVIRTYLGLGVNYIESLVNRHRVELFVLDTEGRVAATFERLQWDENEVVNCLERVLAESKQNSQPAGVPPAGRVTRKALSAIAPLASVAAAFFPKCPVCWTAYLSVLGIASLGRLAYMPWLVPLLLSIMAVNVASLWVRGRATGRMLAFGLGLAGACAIAVPGTLLGVSWARSVGVALTLAASLMTVAESELAKRRGRPWRAWGLFPARR